MNRRYFFLNADSILVDGDHDSAIYDLRSGDIVALDPDPAAILRLSERGSPTEEIASLLAKDLRSVEETLSSVVTRGLGRFYNRRAYIEKSKQRERMLAGFFQPAPVIRKCFIELASTCGLECSFCEAPKLYPCAMCSKSSSGELDERNLYAFLKRLVKMQCASLVFHGGDPLSHPDKLFPIVEFCRAEGFNGEIFVITNGTNIGDAVIRSLASYKVHPVIPFAQEMGGLISESKLRSLAQAFHGNQIEFTLTLVIHSNNASSIRRMRDFAEGLRPTSIPQAVVLGDDEKHPTEVVKALGKQVMRVSWDVFHHTAEYHPCLSGILALSTDGRLLPCPFLTDEVMGRTANPRLIDEVFETRGMDTYWELNVSHFETKMIDPYWQLTLSRIERCKDCAFKYGCFDCRAVEKYLTGRLDGKKMCALNKQATI